LRDAGFDMDLDGKDSHSIQYQNANNSVRVTDEFMEAVLDDADWHLKSVTTGETLQTVKARALFRQISKAAWECADPGMQFDTTINRWHTAPKTGRINASNPCFPGDALVHTDKGLIAFKELFARANDGEHFGVYTHDATNGEAPARRVELTSPEALMITGTNEIVKLRFDNGMELRCTPNHRLFTVNRGYVEAQDLTAEDAVQVLDVAAPALGADLGLPVAPDPSAYRHLGDHRRPIQLPEKWTPELGHYLGWLVGDGSAEDQELVAHRHREFTIVDDRNRMPGFFRALGRGAANDPSKSVPWSVLQAPPEIAASFLQGLFDANGCVCRDDLKGSYVGLGAASRALLVDVQRLLSTFGIASTVDRAGEEHQSFDLRISASSIPEFARHIDFSIPRKSDVLHRLVSERVRGFSQTDTNARLVERVEDGVETTYNLCEPRNHSYVVNGLVVRNCSEYMHLDDSACNLASLNLLTFLEEESTFDVDGFTAATEVMFTAQEILVGNADYPTTAIGDTSRRFRQLGIGYANLGALLMAQGVPYDSDEGRAWAATITALLTGHSYATSARTAARMGPFAGFTDNREAMLNVLRMHRDEVAGIDEELVPTDLLSAAQEAWDAAVEVGEQYGVRNSQASVLAPTGCLVGGSLIPTERGLVRLQSLGDPDGAKWQDLGIAVATDEGSRRASKFYVNGAEAVVTVSTGRGYRVQGTPAHRVKVVDRATGEWQWKRFAEITAGDVVPLALDQLIGEPQVVGLPPLPEAYWTGEHHGAVTRTMTAELAELVGYFMGGGYLHSRGLRFCVTAGDFDVVERLLQLGKETFGLLGHVTPKRGHTEVRFDSVRLALWWEACGFGARLPSEEHSAKGRTAHVPDAVLHANARTVYAAFLRGIFEADGGTTGYPTLKSASVDMVRDVQAIMLALGYPTTMWITDGSTGTSSGRAPIAVPIAALRLLHASCCAGWLDEIGFMSDRKNAGVRPAASQQGARRDYIPITRALVDRLAPVNDRLRRVLLTEVKRNRVSRQIATELYERTGDPGLGHLLRFFYDEVASAEVGDDQFTYDLSVPDNVTYLANGFVSHNTIGLLMDCDTTGIEPDLGLVKTKKLVGGGTMSIVNQTVPRALRRLGYDHSQVDAIIAYIDEHKSILGAPALKAEHLPVFACSMGDNTIHYRGHVRMMGAVQPFISGAISKCVTGDTLLSTAEGLVRIGSLYRGEEPDSFRADVREVASLSGPQKTDAFYYGGVRPVTSVVLRSGHRVSGTANHRLLVSGRDGLEWRRLDEIAVGEYVATQYGDDLWSVLPARLEHGVSGSTEEDDAGGAANAAAPAVPAEMSGDLAFVLGAYAASGRIPGGGWAVQINSDVGHVLDRLGESVERVFGVTGSIRQPGGNLPGARIEFRSQAIVELFDDLGCGQCAVHKRIPDAVLRSPRDMVLAYLHGLSIAAEVTMCGTAKWALTSESPGLLDDLQAVLTNLGVVHERGTRYRKNDGRPYDEVFAVGEQAHDLLTMVPFLDPHKAAFAQALQGLGRHPNRNGADVVPGISPYELYRIVPRSQRSDFSYLSDPRAMCVSRRSLEQVAAVAGARLPQWLRHVLEDNLHFSPVESVGSAGEREVFDLSVPTTQAFVGNGIVNHNTVNLPEEATLEEVEQLHIEAWQLGLKAVAIYRDNCKVGQPLATTKKTLADPETSEAEAHDAELALKVAELEKALQRQTVVVKQPVRERLPRRRRSMTFKFRVADCEGYVTVGEYDDGRPGEVFMQVSKQGSTLAGIMDAFAVAVSLGLQHGVPLATYVKKYTNMRFEPAGMTDDRELRIASSLVDYIFRRLAVDYLTFDERAELGILTTDERLQPTLPGVEEVTTPSSSVVEEMTEDRASAGSSAAGSSAAGSSAANLNTRPLDAPYCYQCGVQMQRAGSCFACPSCGSTSGCS
ncbi:MAG: ribonucleoside-diphosphate reductase alpha chain, partial [Acidimicrobiaceae bacterium]|nr:ribonucleoside-diphosphate reductase alpha chain [Acidimicrobiaceae bacterium]